MEIWLNPACSKCRTAVSSLDAAGVEYTVRRYLDDPPTADDIREVLNRLRLEPWDIARLSEKAAAEIGITSWPKDGANRERWIQALADNPTLIQRPIITAADGSAVVGRSPEAVQAAIDAERKA